MAGMRRLLLERSRMRWVAADGRRRGTDYLREDDMFEFGAVMDLDSLFMVVTGNPGWKFPDAVWWAAAAAAAAPGTEWG